MTKVIAVGGVAGGATAASQLRRLDPDIGITIYERYEEISYGSCGMPYHISGEVETRDSLVNMTPEKFTQKNIDVKTCHEVIAVHPHNHNITVITQKKNIDDKASVDY